MNKQYLKGYRFELKVKKYLEDNSYLCFRTAGSHSIADVIAICYSHTLLVQCKAGKGFISKPKYGKLIKQAEKFRCIPVLATSEKGKITLEAYSNEFDYWDISKNFKAIKTLGYSKLNRDIGAILWQNKPYLKKKLGKQKS